MPVFRAARVVRIALTLAVVVAGPRTAAAKTYEVGPEKAYVHPLTVPWEDLEAGDEVVIHPGKRPYQMKWVLCVAGTAERPIVVRGVRGEDGKRPVISGEEAITPPRLVYNGGVRSLLKIGAASVPEDRMPEHLVIEGLEFRSAREGHVFYYRRGPESYVANAAGVFVEKGRHITLRDCRFADCGNGLFVAPETAHLKIHGCEFVGNGNRGSFYEHNSYTSSVDIEFVGCYFGPLLDGAGGNNLKDRSAGLTVRNCWFEDGNRQLDLVDAQDASWIVSDPAYRTTWVVGNVLIESETINNNQFVHYGGDSGATDQYRKGTLKLWHNTIVSKRPKATVLRLSTGEETADLRGNILYTVNGGAHLGLLDDMGRVTLDTNWIRRGWRRSFGSEAGIITEKNTLLGMHPGFVDLAGRDLRLAEGSDCVDVGTPLDDLPYPADDALDTQFAWPSGTMPRVDPGKRNLGAIGIEPIGAPSD